MSPTSSAGPGSPATNELPTYRVAVVNSHPIQYFAPLYRRLASESDIDLTVYFCSRAGLEVYEDAGFGGEEIAWDIPLVEGYDHVFLSNLGGERPPGGFWSLVNTSIIPELRSERYDAVWLHGHAYATDHLAALGARAAGSALFMRCDTHLGLDRPLLRRVLRGPVMTAFYRLFDACLAIGSRNAEFYRRHRVPERKIFPVPYAVDNDHFRAGSRTARERPANARRTLGLPPREVPVVLFLSKLTRQKRPMDLLRAFRAVRDQQDFRFALALAGAGPERERLGKFVERHDVPDVHFLGFRNQSEVPGIYGACDVFVLPSENESWGLVVNEAMCAGLPVVVSEEVGGAVDLVRDGENGFQYPAGDVAALAERLERLVTDEELLRRMGQASLEIIDEWDLGACVEGVRAALRATCEVPDERQGAARRSRGEVMRG